MPNADFTNYTINSINYSPIATGTVVWSDEYGNILTEDLSLTVRYKDRWFKFFASGL